MVLGDEEEKKSRSSSSNKKNNGIMVRLEFIRSYFFPFAHFRIYTNFFWLFKEIFINEIVFWIAISG